jgi:hypothetical protein
MLKNVPKTYGYIKEGYKYIIIRKLDGMKSYDLRFGKIIPLSDKIAEVIVDDGIEMDEAMTDEYHNCLIGNFQAPFSVLINKINRYTYTFPAQQKLAAIEQMNAIAIVAYTSSTEHASKAVALVPRAIEWKYRIFDDRESALQWLIAEEK